jgi:hypothetical protein
MQRRVDGPDRPISGDVGSLGGQRLPVLHSGRDPIQRGADGPDRHADRSPIRNQDHTVRPPPAALRAATPCTQRIGRHPAFPQTPRTTWCGRTGPHAEGTAVRNRRHPIQPPPAAPARSYPMHPEERVPPSIHADTPYNVVRTVRPVIPTDRRSATSATPSSPYRPLVRAATHAPRGKGAIRHSRRHPIQRGADGSDRHADGSSIHNRRHAIQQLPAGPARSYPIHPEEWVPSGIHADTSYNVVLTVRAGTPADRRATPALHHQATTGRSYAQLPHTPRGTGAIRHGPDGRSAPTRVSVGPTQTVQQLSPVAA